jgi:phosphoribosylanthranilate isomerase
MMETPAKHPGPVYVKICGITRSDDALTAVALGAHALGFVFYKNSPRHIDLHAAAAIARKLPAGIIKVGVFVNPGHDVVKSAVSTVGLDAIQLHGVQTAEELPMIPGVTVILAVAVRAEGPDARAAALIPLVDAVLLDTYHPVTFGGTGTSFDWQHAQPRQLGKPLILAGGLNPENIRRAVEEVRPYAVDVSSGVEERPGRKDADKLRRFFMNLKGFIHERQQKNGGFLIVSR